MKVIFSVFVFLAFVVSGNAQAQCNSGEVGVRLRLANVSNDACESSLSALWQAHYYCVSPRSAFLGPVPDEGIEVSACAIFGQEHDMAAVRIVSVQ